MTSAFLVSRRTACLRVLAYLLAAFLAGAVVGRVSASSPAARATPATQNRVGESDTVTAERAAEHPGFDAEMSDLQGGSASPVAPTRKEVPAAKPAASIRLPLAAGTASWYPADGLIAAVHSWRWGSRPYRVTVCASRCIVVTVSDYCAGCVGGRVIDLSGDAFRLLAPLWRGVVQVTVRW